MNAGTVENETIFLTKVGSQAYGLATEDSDTDRAGVCIPTDKSYYIGMGINKFEQKDKGWSEPGDRVVYDLRKAMNLMADANPNMLDLLFVSKKSIEVIKRPWKDILKHRDKFLSKKVRYTYSGYAYSQLKRIQRHRGYLLNPPSHEPTREEFGLPSDRKLVTTDEMGAFEWLLSKLIAGSVEATKLSEETKEEISHLNYVGMVQSSNLEDTAQAVKLVTGAPDGFIESVMREKKYRGAMSQYRSYNDWKASRNPKRAEMESKYGYDAKHAMHLVRLMRMGVEILKTGVVNVKRPDREELLSVRNGAWPYDMLVDYMAEKDLEMKELYKTSFLPKNPDRVFLDELCQQIIYRQVMRR